MCKLSVVSSTREFTCTHNQATHITEHINGLVRCPSRRDPCVSTAGMKTEDATHRAGKRRVAPLCAAAVDG